MNMTTGNSESRPPYGEQTPKHQLTTKHHYRRRDYDSKICSEGVVWDSQNFIWSSGLGDPQTRPESEGGRDQEILDPDRHEKVSDPDRHEKVSDPNRAQPNPELPDEEDDDETIEEPTREADDPYKPGHGKEGNDSPIEEEFPKSDPKKNIETDY